MEIKLIHNGKEVEHGIEDTENGILLVHETIRPEDDIEVEITKTETEKFPEEVYVGGTKSGAPIKLRMKQGKAIYK